MPIAPPPIESSVSVLTDWFEIAAFAAPDGKAAISEIRSQLDIEQPHEPSDWSDADEKAEDLIEKVCAMVLRRQSVLDASYPFRMSDDGAYLHLKEDVTTGGTIYVFCLLIVQAYDSEVLGGPLVPILSNADRDLFQACATLSAAGFCSGPAISFGWPRPDRTSVIGKLKQIESALISTVRDSPPPGVGAHVKDDEIDVIAWRAEPDMRAPSIYLLGQSASGKNWKGKSLRNAVDHVFHPTWFSMHPPMPPLPAMFVPFSLDDDNQDDGDHDQTPAGGVDWRQTLEMGTIFNRYRISQYAAIAPSLLGKGITPVERLDDIPKIRSWIEDFQAKLQSGV